MGVIGWLSLKREELGFIEDQRGFWNRKKDPHLLAVKGESHWNVCGKGIYCWKAHMLYYITGCLIDTIVMIFWTTRE